MTSDDLDDASGEPGRLRAEVARLTAELTESRQREAALQDQVSATAEVLRIIAASPTDVSVVLQAIVDAAGRLCEADNIGIARRIGNELERVANLDRGPHPRPAG